MTSHDPIDLEEQMEIVAGRKAPFTMIPDWITLHSELDPQAKALYSVLAMHVNVQKQDQAAWPSRLIMAEILGWSREQTPDQYIQQLEAEGAIETEPFTRPNGAKGKRYYVHQTPPPGYTGPTTVAEWYKRKREALAMAAPTPKAGRPRKNAAALQSAKASPAVRTAGDDAVVRPAKKTAAKKPAAKRTATKEKTPEELALDKRAQDGADKWWKHAKGLAEAKQMKPLMGSPRQQSGYFLNLRTKIRDALAADYDHVIIWRALVTLGEWSPAKREWETTLASLKGIPVPRRSGGRAPIFTNAQWNQDGGTPPASAPSPGTTVPDLDDYGFEDDDVA
ncbi:MULTISPECIES: hypothetical protein [unclassified Streptomyces]|uniref:hypothetical protein n=1 Tax=unclassified Streptomyces TaxID=2593676 RepID=UPI0035E03C03